jgi:Ca-activated chloride channel family protein
VAKAWFANPMAFWLFILPGLLAVVGLLALRRRRNRLARLGTLPVLLTLATRRSGRAAVRLVFLFAGLALVIVAVAGPQWGRDWEQAVPSGRDLVVLLDVSRSMLARDVLPSRFERAKKALVKLSGAVEQRGGQRLALVVFAAHAKILCPLTQDYNHFRLALDQIDPANAPRELRPRPSGPTSGTRMGAGLKMAIKAFGPRPEVPGMILMLSDGDDPARDEEWHEAALEAKERKLPVFPVGIGDPRPKGPIFIPLGDDYVCHEDGTRVETKLEEKPLREIARLNGGAYVRERAGGLDLGQLFKDWIEPQAMRVPAADRFPRYKQRYSWFFGAALVLLGTALVIDSGGSRRKRPSPDAAVAEEPEIKGSGAMGVEKRLTKQQQETDAPMLV